MVCCTGAFSGIGLLLGPQTGSPPPQTMHNMLHKSILALQLKGSIKRMQQLLPRPFVARLICQYGCQGYWARPQHCLLQKRLPANDAAKCSQHHSIQQGVLPNVGCGQAFEHQPRRGQPQSHADHVGDDAPTVWGDARCLVPCSRKACSLNNLSRSWRIMCRRLGSVSPLQHRL